MSTHHDLRTCSTRVLQCRHLTHSVTMVDVDGHLMATIWLEGQFNLIVIVVAPLEPGYFRLTVHRDPSV
eukprot:1757701-Rhodomonas_salina.5